MISSSKSLFPDAEIYPMKSTDVKNKNQFALLSQTKSTKDLNTGLKDDGSITNKKSNEVFTPYRIEQSKDVADRKDEYAMYFS